MATSLALDSTGAMGDFLAIGLVTLIGWITIKHPEMWFGGSTGSSSNTGSLDDNTWSGSTGGSSNTGPLNDDMWDEEPEEAAGDGPTPMNDAVEETLWGDDSE
jgi:hypothetical protein